jgi:hypothetical protein
MSSVKATDNAKSGSRPATEELVSSEFDETSNNQTNDNDEAASVVSTPESDTISVESDFVKGGKGGGKPPKSGGKPGRSKSRGKPRNEDKSAERPMPPGANPGPAPTTSNKGNRPLGGGGGEVPDRCKSVGKPRLKQAAPGETPGKITHQDVLKMYVLDSLKGIFSDYPITNLVEQSTEWLLDYPEKSIFSRCQHNPRFNPKLCLINKEILDDIISSLKFSFPPPEGYEFNFKLEMEDSVIVFKARKTKSKTRAVSRGPVKKKEDSLPPQSPSGGGGGERGPISKPPSFASVVSSDTTRCKTPSPCVRKLKQPEVSRIGPSFSSSSEDVRDETKLRGTLGNEELARRYPLPTVKQLVKSFQLSEARGESRVSASFTVFGCYLDIDLLVGEWGYEYDILPDGPDSRVINFRVYRDCQSVSGSKGESRVSR